jgi:hypothetical protein
MYKTNSLEIITTCNKPFEDCCLLHFDELPIESHNNKHTVDIIKSYVTEPFFDVRSMYNNPYQQKYIQYNYNNE